MGLSPTGYVLRANDRVEVVFDLRNEWVGFLVSNGREGFNWFDLDGNWYAFLVPNRRGGFNVFDMKREWTHFLT